MMAMSLRPVRLMVVRCCGVDNGLALIEKFTRRCVEASLGNSESKVHHVIVNSGWLKMLFVHRLIAGEVTTVLYA